MTDEQYNKLREINDSWCNKRNKGAMFEQVTSAEDFLHDMYIEEGHVLTEQNYSQLFHKHLFNFIHKRKLEKSRIVSNDYVNIEHITIYENCYRCNNYYPIWEFHKNDEYYTRWCEGCWKEIQASNSKKDRTTLSDRYIKDLLKKNGIENASTEQIEKKRKELYLFRNREEIARKKKMRQEINRKQRLKYKEDEEKAQKLKEWRKKANAKYYAKKKLNETP